MAASYDFERSSSEYLLNAGLFAFKNNSWTACAWLNVESTPGYSGVISQFDGDNPMVIATHGTSFAVYYGSWLDGSLTISTGGWYFVASTFDGGSGIGTVKLYEGTGLGDFALADSTSVNIAQGTGDVSVGAYRSTDKAYFDGKISHAMLFDSALPIDQLKELLVNPYSITNSGIVFHLPLDGNSSGTDISGQGNDFAVPTAPTASTDGPPVFFPDP